MRIDKYLKVSRLIKRRTLASDACDMGRVLINGKSVKPSATVKEGDTLEILFGNSHVKVRIKNVLEHVSKDHSKEMFEIM